MDFRKWNKILPAYLPPDTVDGLVAKGLEPVTPNTIADPTQLEENLAMIRQQGWAHSVGELTRGVAAIAVWLQDSNDTVVAASRITGLASKFGGKRLPMVIGVTWQAADDISAQPLTWHSTSATAELQK